MKSGSFKKKCLRCYKGKLKQPILITDNYWKPIDDRRDHIEMIQARQNDIVYQFIEDEEYFVTKSQEQN